MENNFATYEISKECKELGFNEHCFAYFNHKKQFHLHDNPLAFYTKNESVSSWCASIFATKESKLNACSAPLWQQVIDFIREEYNFHITLLLAHDEDSIWYDWHVSKIEQSYDYTPIVSSENGADYKEAREQAILEAIKLIKSKTKKGEV